MAPPLNPGDLSGASTATSSGRCLRARNGIRYVRGTHRPKLGVTPKDVVWRSGKAELWRYQRRRRPLRAARR